MSNPFFDHPILNSPYEPPTRHWELDGQGQPGEWPPFSAPTLVTGLTSAETYEHHPSLMGDELEIYFSSSEMGGDFQIWSSARATSDAAWNTASMVTELSSSGTNQDPAISPNGLTIYFASDRAGAGYRIYVSQRAGRDQPWSPPAEMLGLGSSTLDMGPSADPSQANFGVHCASWFKQNSQRADRWPKRALPGRPGTREGAPVRRERGSRIGNAPIDSLMRPQVRLERGLEATIAYFRGLNGRPQG
jgi:hypothetical protein